MSSKSESRLMDASDLERAIEQLAGRILERYGRSQNLALVGIRTRGEFLARRLSQRLETRLGYKVPVGALDTTFYRDDYKTRLKVSQRPTVMGFDVAGKEIVLVDDVLFTGRTIRAALDELTDFGRASSVALAVLVDRGHQELPIRADFVGQIVATDKNQTIKVRLKETDQVDEVVAIT